MEALIEKVAKTACEWVDGMVRLLVEMSVGRWVEWAGMTAGYWASQMVAETVLMWVVMTVGQ